MSSGSESRGGFWDAVAAEPYRVFFPLGVLGALLGGSYWFLLGTGVVKLYAPVDHGLMQIQGFGASFAVGFLLTALPRFMDARPGGTASLAVALALQVATMALVLVGRVVEAQAPFALLMAHVLAFAARCHRQRRSPPPPETIFVVVGLVLGLVGAVCIALAGASWPLPPRLGHRMVEQGMLIAFVLGIGSFLGPRLLGLWEPTAPAQRPGWNPLVARRIWYVAAGALLIASFWIESAGALRTGRWMRVAVLAIQFGPVLRLYRLPRRRAPAGLSLWLSCWFIVAGQALNALLPAYETTVLHVTFVTGFGLMVLMIGMRVTVAHGGCEERWQSTGLPAAVTGLVFAALLLRLAAVLWPAHYVPLLAGGGAVWMAAVLVWAVALVPRMAPRRIAS